MPGAGQDRSRPEGLHLVAGWGGCVQQPAPEGAVAPATRQRAGGSRTTSRQAGPPRGRSWGGGQSPARRSKPATLVGVERPARVLRKRDRRAGRGSAQTDNLPRGSNRLGWPALPARPQARSALKPPRQGWREGNQRCQIPGVQPGNPWESSRPARTAKPPRGSVTVGRRPQRGRSETLSLRTSTRNLTYSANCVNICVNVCVFR